MANYKLGRPRIRVRSNVYRMCQTPRWWNILMHNRPRRQFDKRVCHNIVRGYIDIYDAIFSLNKKPHKYYW